MYGGSARTPQVLALPFNPEVDSIPDAKCVPIFTLPLTVTVSLICADQTEEPPMVKYQKFDLKVSP